MIVRCMALNTANTAAFHTALHTARPLDVPRLQGRYEPAGSQAGGVAVRGSGRRVVRGRL